MFGDVFVKPRRHELFHAQADLALLGINSQYLGLHQLSYAKHVGGLADALLRTDVADVNHALHSFGKLHESAEFCQARDWPFHRCTYHNTLRNLDPWIAKCLFQSKGNAPLRGVDAEDDDLDGFPGLHDITGLSDFTLCPRHLRNVNQTFDTGLKFDERAKIHQPGNCAADTVADFILLRNRVPGMRLELL